MPWLPGVAYVVFGWPGHFLFFLVFSSADRFLFQKDLILVESKVLEPEMVIAPYQKPNALQQDNAYAPGHVALSVTNSARAQSTDTLPY